jgi:hypothetical protein
MTFKTVRRGDPGFTVSDGILVSNRAFLGIDKSCPASVRKVIYEALNEDWVRMNVTFTEEEYTWLILKQ